MCHSNLYGIWTKSLQIIIPDVPFNLWGWHIVGGNLLPVWSTISQASAAYAELTSCNCKKQCSGKYKCCKANLDAHHHATTLLGHCYGNPIRNTLGFLVNCEVAFILYFCDELLCFYIFMQIWLVMFMIWYIKCCFYIETKY